jgi:Uma2 family endonuclease
MKTAATPGYVGQAEGDQLVALENMDWEGYRAFLRLRGGRRHPKVVYLDGRLTLTSPGYAHERLKKRLRGLVEIALEGLGIRFVAAGSTALRRKRRRGGVEWDEAYYLNNLAALRGERRIDLRVDPPPDLAVAVVVSHDADDAVEVYRRLGVPEVWVCTEAESTFLLLDERGDYAASRASRAVPGLAVAEALPWAVRDDFADDFEWRQAFRRWVAEVLAPRRRGGAP